MLRFLTQRIRVTSPSHFSSFKIRTLLFSSKKYTKDHEWIEIKDKVATIGITKYATQHLGEIVFAELPEPGKRCEAGESVAAIESVKAVGEVYSPINGKVIEANPELVEDFSLINDDPESKGWICKIEVDNTSETKELMDKNEYAEYLKSQAD